MKSSSTSQPGLVGSPRLAKQLVTAATAFFIFFGTIVLNMLFPAALFNPAWLMRLATGLIGNAYLPLIGLTLVHVAAYLHPKRSLEDLCSSLAKCAVIASLGFLLLLPLQVWASWSLIQQNFSSFDKGKPAPDEPLAAMEKAIREAPDAATLQTQLTILRGPAITPQDMRRPLPELKQIMLSSLQQARTNLLRKARSTPDPRGWVLVQDVIRFSIGALGYAIGFAAFAQRSKSHVPLLDEWQAALPTRRGGARGLRSSRPRR
jgi:hypothetical protein